MLMAKVKQRALKLYQRVNQQRLRLWVQPGCSSRLSLHLSYQRGLQLLSTKWLPVNPAVVCYCSCLLCWSKIGYGLEHSGGQVSAKTKSPLCSAAEIWHVTVYRQWYSWGAVNCIVRYWIYRAYSNAVLHVSKIAAVGRDRRIWFLLECVPWITLSVVSFATSELLGMYYNNITEKIYAKKILRCPEAVGYAPQLSSAKSSSLGESLPITKCLSASESHSPSKDISAKEFIGSSFAEGNCTVQCN